MSVADQEQGASQTKKPSSPKKNKKRVADFSAQKAPEQCSEFYKSVVKGMQIKINAETLLTKRRKRKEEKMAKGKFHKSLLLPICLLIMFDN